MGIEKARCVCGHQKGQHELSKDRCTNCDCRGFVLDKSITEAAVPLTVKLDEKRGTASKAVGIESHQFVGFNALCEGILGYGVTSPKSGQMCNQPRNATIHTTVPDSGLKDSGQRLQFESGMVRDIDDTKPSFDLVIPEGIPYEELMLTRWAELLRKGAIKYSRRNWEKADSQEELDRAKASAFRHFMQWFSGELDEDHAAAVFFNINEVETIRYKKKAGS